MAEFVYRSMILFVLVFLILQSSGSHGQMLPANFVFGDSLVDVGNNNYLLLSLAKTESIPLRQQVEYYLKVYEYLRKRLGFAHAQKRLSKSLFFIVIGSNDILNYSRSIDQNKPPKKHILHTHGARKVMVVRLPPVGCCLVQRIQNETRGCREDTNTWTVIQLGAGLGITEFSLSADGGLSMLFYECKDYVLVASQGSISEKVNDLCQFLRQQVTFDLDEASKAFGCVASGKIKRTLV
ncbi:hypothetical protein CRG98_002155 [Punica granatum]|uniref:GDSL esterase/lipase At5g55050-like n=1 Tax=Punica granatum TaxID=22663 RepID=A0A2I0LA29_PUNGR|nr:hypothetical protein CRG98_002155 [Punica granatum]